MTSSSRKNPVVNCAYNTIIIGGIANIDDSSYLLLTISKTEELIVDFREKEAKTHAPVYTHGGGQL